MRLAADERFDPLPDVRDLGGTANEDDFADVRRLELSSAQRRLALNEGTLNERGISASNSARVKVRR